MDKQKQEMLRRIQEIRKHERDEQKRYQREQALIELFD